jgi:hypothetical protein
MANQIGVAPTLSLQIEGGQDFSKNFEKFEWASFINSGYIIRAKIVDPYFGILRDVATKEYLEKARVEPTALKFKIQWPDKDPTDERIAYLAYLKGDGIVFQGKTEFIGIDPPSWWLNAGDADGSAWTKNDKNGTQTGKISDVIKSVIAKYTAPDKVGIKSEVTETNDSEENVWWMMRQDPKTFISSILEWSASLTQKKTTWVVASVDRKITIKEQAALPDGLPADKKDFGVFSFNTKPPAATDIKNYELLTNNVISVFQTKLITQGISAVSGRFMDKITEKESKKVFIEDENTENKLNTSIEQDRGFKKPSDKDWATTIVAIPELSGGELGIPYEDYIDGRARATYMDMLNMVMRLRVRIHGDDRFDDSSILGASTVTIAWNDPVEEIPYFLSGKWIIYGFHHIVDRSFWWTDLYLYRIDFDAAARKL